MLDNFPSYLESQTENFSIFDELRKRQLKKNQVRSSEIMQYALLLRYTSLQSYKLLLDEFPLPSISLLNKIKEGNNELYKSIVCFMIIGLKENVPYVVKAVPVTFINSALLKNELLNCLELLITGGFNVRAVICDNHAANVSAFTKLISKFGEDNESLFINFQSQKVYLFYDSVHLIKNV